MLAASKHHHFHRIPVFVESQFILDDVKEGKADNDMVVVDVFHQSSSPAAGTMYRSQNLDIAVVTDRKMVRCPRFL